MGKTTHFETNYGASHRTRIELLKNLFKKF